MARRSRGLTPGASSGKFTACPQRSVRSALPLDPFEEARSHGDLSENAEYDAAKEKQGFLEARVREVEGMLSNANVIDVSELSGDKVLFGATVTILMYDKDEEQKWQIVGDDEADLAEKKIGVSSPIARALIGRETGEEIEIKSPGGIREGEILQVVFA